MRAFTTLFLFFVVFLSFYLVYSNEDFDDIIIIEEPDDSYDDIDNVHSIKDAKKADNTSNINKVVFSWTRGNQKLFYYKIILFICVLLVVILNGIIGRRKNKILSLNWLQACKDIYLENFVKIGYGKYFLLEKSYDNYEFYATGRKNCNCYTVNLNLCKRQCLWRYYIMQYFNKLSDVMHISINFEKLDKNVLCIFKKNQKKNIDNMFPALNKYTKIMTKKELKKIYDIKGDSSEITDLVLSGKVLNFLNSHTDYINYICITDIPLFDYEDDPKHDKNENSKVEKHKFCYLNFNIPGNVDDVRKLISFSIYMIDLCQCIELPERVREHVKKLRSIVEKEDVRKKQELKELFNFHYAVSISMLFLCIFIYHCILYCLYTFIFLIIVL